MRRDNRGFTLIELMLVVAILGVISAITVPGLMRARMSANHASAIASMRGIASAQAVYAASAAGGGYATLLPTLGTTCPGSFEPFLSPDLTWGNNVTKSGYFITMAPSLDDPWAELSVVKPLGAAYSINSNWVSSVSRIAEFEGDEADNLISYLFSGRWDRSTICAGHQRYA